jgi:thymidylate synthase ThyX
MQHPLALAAPFVSSLTDRVFAVHTLPEEIIAARFARYSRTALGFREELVQSIVAGDLNPADYPAAVAFTTDKARAFHEKYILGYGHGSCAEHATVHVALEGISILAAKAIEDCRIGTAFTEKSTRYVSFTRDTHLDLFTLGVPEEFLNDATKAVEGLLLAYTAAVDALTTQAAEAFPGATTTARNGWVFDRARALLPCSIPTSLGMTLNGRSAAAMIRKLKAHPLPEVRDLAVELEDAVAHVLPTLVRHAQVEPGRESRRQRVLAASDGCAETGGLAGPVPAVSVVWSPAPDAWGAVLAEAIVQDADAAGQPDRQHPDDYGVLLDAYLGARGSHEPVGRALEAITGDVYCTMNFAAWRDVQRHRMTSAAPVRLHPRSALQVSADIPNPDAWQAARWAASDVGAYLLAAGLPDVAQYVLPMGTMVHCRLRANLRALFQFIELRSRPEGHDDYRVVAQVLGDRIAQADPLLASYLRVNRDARALARK